ncbi:MAG TPA: MarR family winged helix-turn-helix transcriptional regulator, partial [Aquabacterium sp.]|nr:MarR family winged helix-turn-helix transcriptional regulator [Aquabacterium sp.]
CRRERSTADRRVVNLALTPEGEKVSSAVPEVLADVHNHLLAGFTRDEWQNLMVMLKRLLANAEGMRGGCEFGTCPHESVPS